MRYAILSPAGLPLELVDTASDVLPPGAVELAPGLALEQLAGQMLADGVWLDRPRLVLTAETRADGAHVTLTEGASASRIVIIDLDGAEELLSAEAAPGATWHLPDPGRYAIEAEGPEPWLPATLRIEVTP